MGKRQEFEKLFRLLNFCVCGSYTEMGRQGEGSRNGTRIKWTVEMNEALLRCKKEAIQLAKSENPPRHENGRKIGCMQLMKNMCGTIWVISSWR